MQSYKVFGLHVLSEFALGLDETTSNEPPQAEERVVIRRGSGDIRMGFESGELIAKLGSGDAGYEVRRHEGKHVATFGRSARVTIDVDRGEIEAVGDAKALPSILPNAGLALYCVLKRKCMLHASAFCADGVAYAIAGGSGAGKTTMLGLVCAAGGSAFTDDTLRVECSERGVLSWGGLATLRMRPTAAQVAALLSSIEPRRSVDGRLELDVARHCTSPRALGAIWFPALTPGAARVELRRLSRSAGFAHAMDAIRVRGLLDRELMARQVTLLAELCRAVPTFEVRIPPGPPFPSAWGHELIALASRLEPN